VHRLETISADKNVLLVVEGGIRARGGRLKYDPSIDELELAAAGRNDQAPRIEITPETGDAQTVRALSMVWQGQVARLLATGNVEGDLRLVRLPWADDTPSSVAVASTVSCDKVSVLLDPVKVKSTGFEPLSIHAEGRVSMTQPDRSLTCGVFDYDPRTRVRVHLGPPGRLHRRTRTRKGEGQGLRDDGPSRLREGRRPRPRPREGDLSRRPTTHGVATRQRRRGARDDRRPDAHPPQLPRQRPHFIGATHLGRSRSN
jgi:hypothetical protein